MVRAVMVSAATVPSAAPRMPRLAPGIVRWVLRIWMVWVGKIRRALKMTSRMHMRMLRVPAIFMLPTHRSIAAPR